MGGAAGSQGRSTAAQEAWTTGEGRLGAGKEQKPCKDWLSAGGRVSRRTLKPGSPCPEGLRHGGGQWVTPSACLHRGGPGTCPWVMATPSTSRPMGTRGLL